MSTVYHPLCLNSGWNLSLTSDVFNLSHNAYIVNTYDHYYNKNTSVLFR